MNWINDINEGAFIVNNYTEKHNLNPPEGSIDVWIRFFTSSHSQYAHEAKRILQSVIKESQLDGAIDVEFINIDKQPELAFELGIVALPTILIVAKGKEGEQMLVGLPDPEQLRMLASHAHPSYPDEIHCA